MKFRFLFIDCGYYSEELFYIVFPFPTL